MYRLWIGGQRIVRPKPAIGSPAMGKGGHSVPRMQTAVSALNMRFGAAAIGEVPAEPFAPGGSSLGDALVASGVELDDATLRYVAGWPSALQAALQAAIFENLARDGRVPITFAWAPGYDYELTIWDVRDSAETAGGITVLFRSRYPSDAHPLSAERSSSA